MSLFNIFCISGLQQISIFISEAVLCLFVFNSLLFSSQYFISLSTSLRLNINTYVLPHISENLRPANIWQFYM